MANDIYQTGPVEGRYTPAVSLAGSITPMSSLAGSITPTSSLEGKVAVPKIKEIITVNTTAELPAEGNQNYIYRVRRERNLYQWNPDTREYESFNGNFPYAIGNTLKVEDNVLDVRTAPNVEKDNTLPITSAAVYTEVGNINALLATI